MAAARIQVLVVDDSRVACELLVHILAADPAIEVIGCAASGAEAIASMEKRKPDVITMDIHMPGMDGFEATRRIMEAQPVPIVIVSANYRAEDVAMTFRAMEAGAIAAVEKPPGPADPAYAAHARKLVSMVKAMAEVRVVRRWSKARMAPRQPLRTAVARPRAAIRLVAIGASTGGPPVLQTILAGLRQPFPVPILIVQHISAGFVQGLAEWLTSSTRAPVSLARHGESALPGHVYLAPDGMHLRIDHHARIACAADPPENGLRPSVSCLFRAVAEAYREHAAGVLLTGMGCDGAAELKLMRDRGAVTFAQDEETSIVYGMPGEAVKLGAATYVLPPERIAAALDELICGVVQVRADKH